MTTTVEQFRAGPITTPAELNNPMVTLTVGKIFFDDHENRALVLHSGEREQYLIKETKYTFTLRLSLLDWAEAMSDADYYDDQRQAYGRDYRDLCDSARSLHRSVRKQLTTLGFMNAGESIYALYKRIESTTDVGL